MKAYFSKFQARKCLLNPFILVPECRKMHLNSQIFLDPPSVLPCLAQSSPRFALSLWATKDQGGHWSGKSQGNLIFLQGQGKVREFCRLVREILNTKKVREKSGNLIILAQNMCCSRYFDYLKCEKHVDFFSGSLETMKTC